MVGLLLTLQKPYSEQMVWVVVTASTVLYNSSSCLCSGQVAPAPVTAPVCSLCHSMLVS